MQKRERRIYLHDHVGYLVLCSFKIAISWQ